MTAMAATIKERPIIFSAPMVRAILEGRKTMTRRVVKPQPVGRHNAEEGRVTFDLVNGLSRVRASRGRNEAAAGRLNMHAFRPYGVPGDRLWVREKWCGETDGGNLRWNPDGNTYAVLYAADGNHVIADDGYGGTKLTSDGCEASPWRSPIHMPRWASRITLEITEVRVERLQDISEADAIAEGFERPAIMPAHGPNWPGGEHVYPREMFAKSWQKLNAKRGYSWESNPWVWAISFKRIDESIRAGDAVYWDDAHKRYTKKPTGEPAETAISPTEAGQ